MRSGVEKVVIRELARSELAGALALVRSVFSEFEAPDYGEAGAAEFRRSVLSEEYLGSLVFYGALEDGELVGALAVREGGAHIALLFVDGAHRRRGVGRALFEAACAARGRGRMSVNSSPLAVPVYRALGFAETGAERTVNGIRCTPMACECAGVLVGLLGDKNSALACRACDALCAASETSADCYGYFDRFVELLKDGSSLTRNRAIALIAANARWDSEGRLDAALDDLLAHITDEKPITARRCVAALPEIARQKPPLAGRIAAALRAADVSGYGESMRPLVEKDIANALKLIEEAG